MKKLLIVGAWVAIFLVSWAIVSAIIFFGVILPLRCAGFIRF